MTFAPAVAPGWLRRNRKAAAVVTGLLLVLTLLAFLTAGGRSGDLDPESYTPSGARAIAALLQDRGVQVHRTIDVPSTQALADADSTVFVASPQLLSDDELQLLADLPADLVIAAADPAAMEHIDDSVKTSKPLKVKARKPGCDSPAAARAGQVELGGFTYRGGPGSCYDDTLLELPSRGLTLIGSAELLQNDHLAHEGNAALAIGLLAQHRSLLWLVPDPQRPELGTRPISSPSDLLPDWVFAVVTQLFVTLVVLALWRARRLGRVVPEPLPVVVRAAETVEGRGRLYHAARSRTVAAEELREGTRQRLGPRVGAGSNPNVDSLVTAVAAQTGRTSQEVAALLYGPQPADDAALVRLADDLDALTREVTGS